VVYCVQLYHKYTSDFHVVLLFVLGIIKKVLARISEVTQNLTNNMSDVFVQSLDTQRYGACFSPYVIQQRCAQRSF
jgi:hypothetical protein